MVFNYHTVEQKILRKLINSTKIFSANFRGLEVKRLLEPQIKYFLLGLIFLDVFLQLASLTLVFEPFAVEI